MPRKTKEERAAFQKIYYAKTKEKQTIYYKEYYAKQKTNIDYITKRKESRKKYSKTPQAIKSTKISKWKTRGIIYDLEKLHYLYMNTHRCWVCKNKFKSSRDKCADHDHDINNGENFRFILCQTCNNKDRWRKHIATNRIIKLFKCL